jgi:hypothetical protein
MKLGVKLVMQLRKFYNVNEMIGFYIAILMFCAVPICAQEDVAHKISSQAIRKHIKHIRDTECPKNKDINNISWVQKKIHCLFEEDQYVRNLGLKQPDMFDKFAEVIDKQSTRDVKEMLDVHSWFVISKFGKKTDHEGWLLVQHADADPKFQASVAFLLEQLVPLGETNPQNFAYLYDRAVLAYQHLGLKQKFGTQANIVGSKIELSPFEGTIKDLNQRRKKIGLMTIEEYLKILKEFCVSSSE